VASELPTLQADADAELEASTKAPALQQLGPLWGMQQNSL